MPSLRTGWSCFLPIFAGGGSVEMGSAKMSCAAMLMLISTRNGCKMGKIEGSDSNEVGFGIEPVKIGTDVTCPRVSRTEGMKPLAGVFLLARIWTVPDGPKLVMTLAVDSWLSLGRGLSHSWGVRGRGAECAWSWPWP